MQTLRPLGVGEVLDRAVTLTVRFFVPLALIYVVFAVPLAFVQFFAYRELFHTIAEISNAIQLQAAGGRHLDPTTLAQMTHGSGPTGWSAATVVLAFLIAPLPVGALIEAASACYVGRPVTFGSAYRVGLARWLPLVGINLLYLAAGIALYVAVVLAVFVVALGLAFIAHASRAAGFVLGVPLGLAVVVAAIVFGIAVVLALQTSYFTCVIERESVVRSFSRGLARVFNRTGWRRALLFAAAYFAIALGIALIGLVGQALLVALTHSPAVAAAYDAVLRVAGVVFTTMFVAIFYFDLRVRNEGYDLQLAAEAAQIRPQPV